MIYYYYGNLKDATTDTGEINDPGNYKTQYPLSNTNYLSKKLYSYFDDNGTTGATTSYNMIFYYSDLGSVSTISSFILDVDTLRIQLECNGAEDIGAYYIKLYGNSSVNFSTAVELASITLSKGSDTGGSGDPVDQTVTTIYTETFTEVSYRYVWALINFTTTGSDTVDWDVDGKINNIYVGDYIELPSPAFVPYGFTHKVKSSEAFGGSQFGIDTQGQRKTWAFKYGGLDNDDKTNIESFDLVNKGGSVPCYIESLEGSTQIIDPHFARVYGGETLQQIAYRVYEMTNNIEEEL